MPVGHTVTGFSLGGALTTLLSCTEPERFAAAAPVGGIADIETNPAEGARLVSYDCPAGAEVEFYILEGAGHTWPGSEFHVTMESVVGPTIMSIDATETMWAFFEAHARP